MGTRATLLSLSCICLLPASLCFAATINALSVPGAVVSQAVDVPSGASNGSNTFGAVQVAAATPSSTGSMVAKTTAYGGTAPSVSSFVSVNGALGSYSNGHIDADSELLYYFEVAGPTGGPVPVVLTASGQTSTTDPLAYAYASLDVLGTTNIYNISACSGNSLSFCNTAPNPQQFAISTVLQATPNQIYTILIESNIQSGTYSGPLPTGVFNATAWVDPTLQLRGDVSGDYSILTSANLSQTPEPNTIILAGSGVFFLAAYQLRRQHAWLDASTSSASR